MTAECLQQVLTTLCLLLLLTGQFLTAAKWARTICWVRQSTQFGTSSVGVSVCVRQAPGGAAWLDCSPVNLLQYQFAWGQSKTMDTLIVYSRQRVLSRVNNPPQPTPCLVLRYKHHTPCRHPDIFQDWPATSTVLLMSLL